MTVYCPNCGKPNTDEAASCVSCGSELKKPAGRKGSKFKGTMMMTGVTAPQPGAPAPGGPAPGGAPPAAAPPAGGGNDIGFQATMMGPIDPPADGAPAPGAPAAGGFGQPPAGGDAGAGFAPAAGGPPPGDTGGGFGAPAGGPPPGGGGFGQPAGGPPPGGAPGGGFGQPAGGPPPGGAPGGGFGQPAGGPPPGDTGGGFGAPAGGPPPGGGGFGQPAGGPPPGGGFGAPAGGPPPGGGFGGPPGGQPPGGGFGGPPGGQPPGGGFGGPPMGGAPGAMAAAPEKKGKSPWLYVGIGCLAITVIVGGFMAYCTCRAADAVGEFGEAVGGGLMRVPASFRLGQAVGQCATTPASAAEALHPNVRSQYQAALCQSTGATVSAIGSDCSLLEQNGQTGPCTNVSTLGNDGHTERVEAAGLPPESCFVFSAPEGFSMTGCMEGGENEGDDGQFWIVHIENPTGVAAAAGAPAGGAAPAGGGTPAGGGGGSK